MFSITAPVVIIFERKVRLLDCIRDCKYNLLYNFYKSFKRVIRMKKISIAFISVGNSCRSQMAEGFARHYGNSIKNIEMEIYSAGTQPAISIVPETIRVMDEAGINIRKQYPKTLDKIPGEFDLVFTMGCNVSCPFLPSKYREDWGFDDPIGMPIEFFRSIRDRIDKKVRSLMNIITSSNKLEDVIETLKKPEN
jgi:arsenate reductase